LEKPVNSIFVLCTDFFQDEKKGAEGRPEISRTFLLLLVLPVVAIQLATFHRLSGPAISRLTEEVSSTCAGALYSTFMMNRVRVKLLPDRLNHNATLVLNWEKNNRCNVIFPICL